jgi:8-oxo-dGTP pyrophosphatase MutT (NUDIX family)
MPDAALPLPSADLVSRARQFIATGGTAAPSKLASTVILMRDGVAGLEVFMMRRQLTMSFGAGMHVFPGGVVDVADRVGRTPAQARVVAAVRETFEECGVVLASGTITEPDLLETDRVALIEHRATLDEVFERHRLQPADRALRPWARWITPEFEPRRYDTMFYVALAPPDNDARYLGGESDTAEWVTPSDALDSQRAGRWLLMPPTEHTLRELAEYGSAEAVFAAAEGRPIDPILTTIDLDAEPPRFVLTQLSST